MIEPDQLGVEDRVVVRRTDPGVIEGDVDPAIGVVGNLEEVVHVDLVGDIAVDIGATDLLSNLGTEVVGEIRDDDLGALLCEPADRRKPDPRAPARDHRDFAVEPSRHVNVLPRVRC